MLFKKLPISWRFSGDAVCVERLGHAYLIQSEKIFGMTAWQHLVL
jgi:hypothetical protein